MASRKLVPAFAFLAIGLAGCSGGVGQNAASSVLKTPEMPADKEAKCRLVKSQSEPLIVEWPDAARARLESMSRKGLVAVKYEGCELSVLSRCAVKNVGNYGYSPVTRRVNKVTIRDADDLYLKMPVGAFELEGKLKSAGQLNVQMTIVGRWESNANTVFREDLEGDCESATHVIHALTVGAFTFSSGADAEVGAGAHIGAAGGGARSTAARETLQRDGDEAACNTSSATNKEPPEGCAGPFQIEVMPLARGSKPVAVAPVPVPVPAPTAAPVPAPAPSAPSSNDAPPPLRPPKCKRGEHVEDGVCVKGLARPKPATKPGKQGVTALNVVCAPGQRLADGHCVDAPDPAPREPKPPPPREPPAPREPVAVTCGAGKHLERGACIDDPPPRPDPPRDAPQEVTPTPAHAPTVENQWRTIFFYTGAIAALAGGLSGAAALSEVKSAKDECAVTCSPAYQDRRDAAVRWAVASDVGLGLAILSFGVVWLLPATVSASAKGGMPGVSGRF